MDVPELLTVREVATLLKISPAAVTRRFQDLPGVIDWGAKRRGSSGRTKYCVSLDLCLRGSCM
jgi:hypothetical protein